MRASKYMTKVLTELKEELDNTKIIDFNTLLFNDVQNIQTENQ